MTLQTLPDIVGANAKVPISTTQGQKARRLFLTPTGGKCRFGDTNVAAARGVELNTDVETTISTSDADMTDLMDLTQAFAYVPSGTTLTITFSQ